jgi:predicted Zn-dependent protease
MIKTKTGSFVNRGLTNGKSSIISTFKIHKDAGNYRVFKKYLAKVALHECGHFFGLVHCKYSCKCFMIGYNLYCNNCPECVRINDLNDMKKFYDSDNTLCNECKKELNSSIQELIEKKIK